MKKIFLLIYILLFIFVCALPGAVMLAGIKTENLEKRQLAEMPAFSQQGKVNLQFPKQFEDYMNDNFGLRQYYVTGWATLEYYLLGTSSNSSVIAGRDGWLYFGDEAHDYLGRDILSAADISRIVRTLQLENEYLASKGVSFVFTVAPNKSTVYGEYMPARYMKESADGNMQRLAASLKGSGVEYSDLASALMAQKGTAQLYHKKDSHWNNIGALIGYNTLLGSVSKATGGFQYDTYANAKYTWKRDWSGDLETMLLPALGNLDMQAEYDIPQAFKYASRPRTMEDMRIESSSGANGARLLMFRDSFANALIPVLSNAFGYACYARNFPYDLTMLDNEKPGVVIQEIVERNIPNLLKAAPVMAAPIRNVVFTDVLPLGDATASTEPAGGSLIKISGWAAGTDVNAKSAPQLYVELSNASGSRVYEPFPIGPADKQQSDGMAKPLEGMENPVGFTMYLDESALDKGTYDVYVLVDSGNGVQRASAGLQVAVK